MKFAFTLTGVSPLLMHADDVEKSDMVQHWRKSAENKALRVAGDDRSPPWTWQTYLISDGKHLCVTVDMLSACLRQAGSMVSLGKRGTMKSVSQSGLFVEPDFMPILVGGKPIKASAVDALKDLTFKEQAESVPELGFDLHMKRARVGQAKHVRIRPKFDEWKLQGTVEVLVKEIDEPGLRELFRLAGLYKGIGDWRASAASPGRFGKFSAELKKL